MPCVKFSVPVHSASLNTSHCLKTPIEVYIVHKPLVLRVTLRMCAETMRGKEVMQLAKMHRQGCMDSSTLGPLMALLVQVYSSSETHSLLTIQS